MIDFYKMFGIRPSTVYEEGENDNKLRHAPLANSKIYRNMVAITPEQLENIVRDAEHIDAVEIDDIETDTIEFITGFSAEEDDMLNVVKPNVQTDFTFGGHKITVQTVLQVVEIVYLKYIGRPFTELPNRGQKKVFNAFAEGLKVLEEPISFTEPMRNIHDLYARQNEIVEKVVKIAYKVYTGKDLDDFPKRGREKLINDFRIGMIGARLI